MYAVIMAGGEGTRFWPRSRSKQPKQLLNIVDSDTMIQSTVKRLKGLVDWDHILVVTTIHQKDAILEQLPLLSPENLVIEPKGKNTAPCIGLAATLLDKKDPDDVMVVLPADHRIENDQLFRKTLRAAAHLAETQNGLVTIGIDPTYPATGYGYIQHRQLVENIDGIEAYSVKTFAEKPDIQTAKRFLKSGDFFWNSGIFIWKTSKILQEIEDSLPELHSGLMRISEAMGTNREAEVIEKVYCQIKSMSIDYGVMEHSRNVFVVKGKFAWNDVGSWDEVYKIFPKDKNGNAVTGQAMLLDTKNCFVDVKDLFVGAIGLENMIVVRTSDALLICPRERAQEVRDLVDLMKRKKLDQFL
ncbi:MAG: mannose-1-phosphate guanylyltransferase [Calditrichaeota bacterium]|nr:mannose-1-phosphate guanylyltransferase [Calditrichota bacterium]